MNHEQQVVYTLCRSVPLLIILSVFKAIPTFLQVEQVMMLNAVKSVSWTSLCKCCSANLFDRHLFAGCSWVSSGVALVGVVGYCGDKLTYVSNFSLLLNLLLTL